MRKALVCTLIIFNTTAATIINVPSDYSTIQSAIDAASDGDTVSVVAGTYKENINFNQKNIYVLGANRETTIIDGDQKGSVVTFNGDAYGNMTNKYLNTVLAGFTITNGNNVDNEIKHGGGITINGDAKPTLRDLIIEKNQAWDGAGIYLNNSASPNIENSIIRNNDSWWSGRGGGIYLNNYSGTMKNLLFVANTANG